MSHPSLSKEALFASPHQLQFIAVQQRKSESDKAHVGLSSILFENSGRDNNSVRSDNIVSCDGCYQRNGSSNKEQKSSRSVKSSTVGSGTEVRQPSAQCQSIHRQQSQRSRDSVNITDKRKEEYNDQRSSQRSFVSTTSSVALRKLDELESTLMQERKAREKAEEMLADMRKQRAAKERGVRRTEQSNRQQEDVIMALRNTAREPDSNNLNTLQSIIRMCPESLSLGRPPISNIPM